MALPRLFAWSFVSHAFQISICIVALNACGVFLLAQPPSVGYRPKNNCSLPSCATRADHPLKYATEHISSAAQNTNYTKLTFSLITRKSHLPTVKSSFQIQTLQFSKIYAIHQNLKYRHLGIHTVFQSLNHLSRLRNRALLSHFY